MKVKYIIAGIVFIVLVGGAVKLFSSQGNSSGVVEALSIEEVSKIAITPDYFDVGKVPMKGGLVTREYDIKNGASKGMLVKKIVTSCMCTKAAVQVGEKSTRFYGMEMAGDKNPRLDFEIPAGAVAKLVVRYDPAAHGIAGKGPFDRTVEVTFADPVGVKSVRFSGEVVLE